MKPLNFALCFALSLFLANQAAFGQQTISWHQRLTLIVETPQGEVRGSAVTEVTNVLTDGDWVLPEARGVRSTTKGEAVVVEVTPGHYLFALLDGVDHFAYAAFALNTHPDPTERSYEAAMRKLASVPLDTPAALDPNDVARQMHDAGFPILVTFTDITDPKTVRKVDPENLAASFGPGVSLKAATLEVTQEPVSERQVEAVLGWLGEIWPNMLDGRRYQTIKATNRLANSLGAGSFSTEIRK